MAGSLRALWGWGFLVDGTRLIWPYVSAAVPVYICNHTALALGLEGTPDPPLAVVQAAVTKYSYTGYVAPEYVAPVIP